MSRNEASTGVSEEARPIGLWWKSLDDKTRALLEHLDKQAHDQLEAGIQQAFGLERTLPFVLGDGATGEWQLSQFDALGDAVVAESADVTYVMVDNNEVTSEPPEPQVGETFILSWSDTVFGGKGLPGGYVDHIMLGADVVATANSAGGPANTTVPMQVRVPGVDHAGDYPLSIITNADGSRDFDGASAPPPEGIAGGGMLTTIRIGGGGSGAGDRDASGASANLTGSLQWLMQALQQGDTVEIGNQLAAVHQHSQMVFGGSASQFAQHHGDTSSRSWDQLQIDQAEMQEMASHIEAAWQSMANPAPGADDGDAQSRILYVSQTLLQHQGWNS